MVVEGARTENSIYSVSSQEDVGDLSHNSIDSATSVGSRPPTESSGSTEAFQGSGASIAVCLDQPSPSSCIASQRTLDMVGNGLDQLSLATDGRESFEQGGNDFSTSLASGQAREGSPGPSLMLGSMQQCRKSVYQRYGLQSAKSRLMDLMEKPLSPHEQKTGFLYIRRSRNSEYFSVGCTTNETVEGLLAQSDKCTKDCPIIYPLSNPHRFAGAMRAKALIIANLHKARHWKKDCQGCGGKTIHENWFQVSEDEILRSVQVFTDYICSGLAYDESGKLTPAGKEAIKITISYNVAQVLGPTRELLAAESALISGHDQEAGLKARPYHDQDNDPRRPLYAQTTISSAPGTPYFEQIAPGTDVKTKPSKSRRSSFWNWAESKLPRFLSRAEMAPGPNSKEDRFLNLIRGLSERFGRT